MEPVFYNSKINRSYFLLFVITVLKNFKTIKYKFILSYRFELYGIVSKRKMKKIKINEISDD